MASSRPSVRLRLTGVVLKKSLRKYTKRDGTNGLTYSLFLDVPGNNAIQTMTYDGERFNFGVGEQVDALVSVSYNDAFGFGLWFLGEYAEVEEDADDLGTLAQGL